MDRTVVFLFACLYLGLGFWGLFLAQRLYGLACEDRGIARHLRQDALMVIVANKLVRQALNRGIIAGFGIVTGMLALLPRPPREPACSQGGSALGWFFLLMILFVMVAEIVLSWKDLQDRGELTA